MFRLQTPIQCGCRRNRSSTDHLIRLETNIRKASAHNEHVISVFFDLAKACDTTWKYGILRDLHRIGLRGRLPVFIEHFLNDGRFRVRSNNNISDEYTQEQGVPQESVLCVTLFAIKINDLAKQLPVESRYDASLYVDYFHIAYRHSDLDIVRDKLQFVINQVVT